MSHDLIKLGENDPVRFTRTTRYGGNNSVGPFRVHQVIPNGPDEYHVSIKDKTGKIFLGDSAHGQWSPLHLEIDPDGTSK